jgi:hypothetical protein
VNPPVTVSVVLPVWNGERFLAEAIESILSQTFDSFELIVVDDGSTDSTAEIAFQFARRDPRVQVIRLEHNGIAHALNAGIARARGLYIARMDGDDVAHPARLQKQVAFLDANADCVAVGSAIEVIDEGGEHLGMRMFPEHHDDIIHTLMNTWSTAIAHPTLMTRMDALREVGGYRPACVPSEDLDLWFHLSGVGKLANLGESLLRYRRHRDTVGIRDHVRQLTMGAAIVNEIRSRRGLRPLRLRVAARVRNRLASYHFECARTALLSGPRRAAIRHARAAIVSDPSWAEPYVALLACVFPKWTIHSVRALRDLSIAALLPVQ